MARAKRNLLFAVGAVVALALIAFASFSRFAVSSHNAGADKSSLEANDVHAASNDLVPLSGLTKATDAPASGVNETMKITLHCRAVNLTRVTPDADTKIAYALEHELKASWLFDPNETKLGPNISVGADTNTLTFDVTLALKRPIRL